MMTGIYLVYNTVQEWYKCFNNMIIISVSFFLIIFLWSFLLFRVDAEILKIRKECPCLISICSFTPQCYTLEDMRRWKTLVVGQRTFVSSLFSSLVSSSSFFAHFSTFSPHSPSLLYLCFFLFIFVIDLFFQLLLLFGPFWGVKTDRNTHVLTLNVTSNTGQCCEVMRGVSLPPAGCFSPFIPPTLGVSSSVLPPSWNVDADSPDGLCFFGLFFLVQSISLCWLFSSCCLFSQSADLRLHSCWCSSLNPHAALPRSGHPAPSASNSMSRFSLETETHMVSPTSSHFCLHIL